MTLFGMALEWLGLALEWFGHDLEWPWNHVEVLWYRLQLVWNGLEVLSGGFGMFCMDLESFACSLGWRSSGHTYRFGMYRSATVLAAVTRTALQEL